MMTMSELLNNVENVHAEAISGLQVEILLLQQQNRNLREKVRDHESRANASQEACSTELSITDGVRFIYCESRVDLESRVIDALSSTIRGNSHMGWRDWPGTAIMASKVVDTIIRD